MGCLKAGNDGDPRSARVAGGAITSIDDAPNLPQGPGGGTDQSMQSDFFVETQTNGRAVTLTMSGELDLVSAPVLERALGQLTEPEVELIIVDLRGLAFMDSTGLHLLIQAQQRAHDSGRSFALVRGAEQVQRLLDVTGVGDALTIVSSPEELLEVDQAPGAP